MSKDFSDFFTKISQKLIKYKGYLRVIYFLRHLFNLITPITAESQVKLFFRNKAPSTECYLDIVHCLDILDFGRTNIYHHRENHLFRHIPISSSCKKGQTQLIPLFLSRSATNKNSLKTAHRVYY